LDKNDLHINILSILAASQHDDHIMDEYEIAMNLDQTINSIHYALSELESKEYVYCEDEKYSLWGITKQGALAISQMGVIEKICDYLMNNDLMIYQ